MEFTELVSNQFQENGRVVTKMSKRVIAQISKGNQSAADVVAELGTMKDGGILPDSYPESAEPDDDFLMLSNAKVSDGDRVLLIWTDAEEIVVIGKVEGDEEDAG